MVSPWRKAKLSMIMVKSTKEKLKTSRNTGKALLSLGKGRNMSETFQMEEFMETGSYLRMRKSEL